ncbi:acyl-CoA thioesterase YciA [Endobacter medicaginis]|uniref:Acyl-CoA thioesterase n=1 Tax=Endobacter medicaginis TaxID=1181271 RepID=A0A839UZ55_9PROT|nr:acyl-CoA thioesterase [Endobacter medicaginis]MBB3175076.1 acyl-CoA thioesterase YciA [Endobacter medicaginis]MCX5476216.1 acyl-CoA thioesterase [Endobacter medicaginis]NVN30535.1 acyl-CoA thioesterase [Endobacter medicaginis]
MQTADAPAMPPEAQPTIRVIAMPSDTNPAGEIFGGWIVSHMDLAAGSLAARTSGGRCVTVAIDGLTFLSAVTVGDELSIYTSLLRLGRTSMQIRTEAWCRQRHASAQRKVTEGTFVFVAIGDDKRPRVISSEPEAG